MTDYATIRGVSLSLKDLFKEHITDDPDATLNGVPVDLRSPRELELATVTDAVSVWLYLGELVEMRTASSEGLTSA